MVVGAAMLVEQQDEQDRVAVRALLDRGVDGREERLAGADVVRRVVAFVVADHAEIGLDEAERRQLLVGGRGRRLGAGGLEVADAKEVGLVAEIFGQEHRLGQRLQRAVVVDGP